VDDRDKALKLKSSKITVPRDRFPPLESGQYYWADLVGLEVSNLDGAELGTIAEMLATGANDVIVAKAERERLIPFVMGQFVKEIKLDEGKMLVDWDVDF
jgi:16S rRNA processing protein RimM